MEHSNGWMNGWMGGGTWTLFGALAVILVAALIIRLFRK